MNEWEDLMWGLRDKMKEGEPVYGRPGWMAFPLEGAHKLGRIPGLYHYQHRVDDNLTVHMVGTEPPPDLVLEVPTKEMGYTAWGLVGQLGLEAEVVSEWVKIRGQYEKLEQVRILVEGRKGSE